MDDYRAKLGINTDEYDSGLENAKKKTEQFQKTADNTGKTLKDLEGKSRTAGRILQDIAGSEKGAKGMSNYRGQLMKITKQIQDLTVAYRSMDAEMRGSAIGQETAAKIRELTNQAAIYKDAIADVQQEITRMASDTAIWDGMKQGIQGVSSVLQTFAAAGVLGERNTEKLVKVIAKLKAAEAATNAVINIGNMLQKNSAAVAAIRTVQLKLQTVATTKATIAQKALNVAMKANPVGILIGLLAAVAAGIAIFTARTKTDTEAQKAHNQVLENAKQAQDDYRSTVGGAVGQITGKFNLLQRSYKNLSSEMEKRKWIDQNKDAFAQLGLKITSVNDADEVFIKQSSAVIEALKARARAQALEDLYIKTYQKHAEEEIALQQKLNRVREENKKSYQGSGNKWRSEWTKAGLTNDDVKSTTQTMQSTAGAYSSTFYELTESGKAKLDEYFKNLGKSAGQAIVDGIQSELDLIEVMYDKELKAAADAEREVGKYLVNPGDKSGGGDIKPAVITADKFEKGSLSEAQKLVSKLQQELNDMAPDNPKFEETKMLLAQAEERVKQIKQLMEGVEPPKELDLIPNTMEEAAHFVQFFRKELERTDPDSDEFEEILDLLNAWEKKLEDIQRKTDKVVGSTKTVKDAYSDIAAKMDDINFDVKIGAMSKADAVKQINELNKQLSSLGLTAHINIDLEANKLDSFATMEFNVDTKNARQQMIDLADEMNRYFNAAADVVSYPIGAINNMVNAFQRAQDTIDDPDASEWETFFSVFQAGESIISAISTAMDTFALVNELLIALKQKETATTMANTAAEGAEASARAANATAAISEAGAIGAKGAAEAGSQAAKVPVIGPVLAVAGILAVGAAIIGIISSLSKFADGGVVGGHSYTGDKILARVNSSELILSKKQQERLLDDLNTPYVVDNTKQNISNVTFRVHGTDLVGVLNNYNNKQKKI